MFCRFCGVSVADDAVFCLKCGKRLGTPSILDASTENTIGKTCPYCQFPVKPGERVVACPVCQVAHHDECWKDNGSKCTTFACCGETNQGVQSSVPIEAGRLQVTPVEPRASSQPFITSDAQGESRSASVSSNSHRVIWVGVILIAIIGFLLFSTSQNNKPPAQTQQQQSQQPNPPQPTKPLEKNPEPPSGPKQEASQPPQQSPVQPQPPERTSSQTPSIKPPEMPKALPASPPAQPNSEKKGVPPARRGDASAF